MARYGTFLTADGLKRTDLPSAHYPDKVVAAFRLAPDHAGAFAIWGGDEATVGWTRSHLRPTLRHICPTCLQTAGIQPDWCDLDFIFPAPSTRSRWSIPAHCRTCAGVVTHLSQPAQPAPPVVFETYAPRPSRCG